MRFPPSFIEKLRDSLEIATVIQEVLPLKRVGPMWKACCPFHKEKTPSFVVYPDQQTYHCFGCSLHGDIIDFYSRYHNKTFVETVTDLAERALLPLPVETDIPQPTITKEQDALLERVTQYYEKHLRLNPEAIAYLKQRQITGQTAKYFRLGYSPLAWDALGQAFSQEQAALKEVGVLGVSAKGTYDRFRGRVIFPIRNRKGQVLGFGGRTLQKDAQAKYVNSPDSEVFHKGQHLFGYYEALQLRNSTVPWIVVEGYFDVISLYQAGFTRTVGSMGTALTERQAKLLLSQKQPIIFAFDGDVAGQNAAWKALLVILPLVSAKTEVKFLLLPEGEDPDSYIRKQGAEAFQRYLDTAQILSTFFFEKLSAEYGVDTVENRAQFSNTAKSLIATMQDLEYRSAMSSALYQKVRPAFTRNYTKTKLVLPQRESLGDQLARWLAHFPELKAYLEIEPLLSHAHHTEVQKILAVVEHPPAMVNTPPSWMTLLSPEARILEMQQTCKQLLLQIEK